MKKCPKCGYVRQALDDEFSNASPNACPRCFTSYDEDATRPELKPGCAQEFTTPSEQPSRGPSYRRPYLMIAMTAVVAMLATLYVTSRYNMGIQKSAFTTDTTKNAYSNVQTPEDDDAPQTVSSIAGRIGPSVVSIIVYNAQREPIGRASGFFINAAGYVITNYHALRGSVFSEVKTASGKTYPVNNVIAEDRTNDLVMVSTGTPSTEVRPLKLSHTSPQVGEKIVVIGNPMGLEQTVSDGIVSALREGRDGRRMIQITAPISPGSSGSPVVNMRGEVIGVAFMQLVGGQNLNFCIPGEILSKLGSMPAYASADFASQSPDRLYCYLDETKKVRFIKNPDTVDPRYVLLTRDDGTPDRDRFEHWVFEILGRNPYRIDPQAEAEAEREKLPEYFSKIFPGYEIEQLGRFAPEARAYWGSWVANRLQHAYDQAARAKQEGIGLHRQLMSYFDQYVSH